GFFAAQSHEVVDVSACPLCHPKLNDALTRLRSIRYPHEAAIVVNPEGDACLVWTEHDPAPLRAVFDTVNAPGDGRPRGSFLFDGVPIVNGCFSQSSLLLNRVLRGIVRECAGSPESLLDLYCGTGNFSLGIESARTVVGVDAAGPAIMAAHRLGRGEN